MDFFDKLKSRQIGGIFLCCGNACGLTSENFLELLAGHRLVVEEALNHIAAKLLEEINLRLRFDALGNRFEIEAFCERDNRGDNLAVLFGEVVFEEEPAVNFQRIKRKHCDKIKAGIARTEIVHGNAIAALLEPSYCFNQLLDVVREQTLGDFKLNVLVRHADVVDKIIQLVAEAVIAEVVTADVKRDKRNVQPYSQPAPYISD